MGAVRRAQSPAESATMASRSPKTDCRVGFVDEIVTGYSRPLSNHEDWTLYYFEEHARQCAVCHDPMRVYRRGEQLCDRGQQYAEDVAHFLWYSRRRGAVFAITGRQEVRVEVPPSYYEGMGLLRAMNRASRSGKAFGPIDARRPASDAADSSSDESRCSTESRGSDYSVKLVAPRQPSSLPRKSRQSHRGSLFVDDREEWMREQKREQRLMYKLETRAPTEKSPHRYS